MSAHRIFGVILRYLYLTRRSWDRIFDLFYWPVIDLLLWGLTAYFIAQFAPNSRVLLIIVSGVVLWLIIWRGQNDIGISLLEDLWNKNMINLFVSPLTFAEWIVSFLILGTVKIFISFPFAALIAYILYRINIFSYGLYLFPFAVLLLFTGWWVGFFVNGLILRFGTKIQVIAWSLVMVIAPFSAVYYPLSILPVWVQKIALILPTTYVFEGARQVISTGILDLNKIYISFLLSVFYLALSIIFLKRSFKKTLDKGLVKLF
jgi:ABC-2 type transport system permease protein